MAQHDFTIANQTASSARSDINSALQALASNSSGTSAPSTTYANMLWYETDTNRLKMRNEGNTAWVDIGYIDQSDGLEILDDTKVVNTSGTQTGLLGDQTTATWQAGTGTTDSLVSPADIKAAILALAPPSIPTFTNLTQGVGSSFDLNLTGSFVTERRYTVVAAIVVVSYTPTAGGDWKMQTFTTGDTFIHRFPNGEYTSPSGFKVT